MASWEKIPKDENKAWNRSLRCVGACLIALSGILAVSPHLQNPVVTGSPSVSNTFQPASTPSQLHHSLTFSAVAEERPLLYPTASSTAYTADTADTHKWVDMDNTRVSSTSIPGLSEDLSAMFGVKFPVASGTSKPVSKCSKRLTKTHAV